MLEKMSINELRQFSKDFNIPINTILDNTLDKIKFLESIYQTGGDNNRFSESFSDAAILERDRLCNLSSMCYSILREKEDK